MSWIASLFHRRERVTPVVKEKLNSVNLEVADQLAEMNGLTRDEVLAQAYRRADQYLYRRGK